MKDRLIKILEEFSNENGSYELKELGSQYRKPLKEDGFTISTKEVYGGGEGDGETHWAVLEVLEDATGDISFWKIPGWYQSYEGATLEVSETFEVKAVEKVVTVWEEK